MPSHTRSLFLKSLRSVLTSGIYLNGEHVQRLEKNISHYFAERYVTAVGSGHDALSLSLLSLNLKNSDEIIFPVNVYPTAFPICQAKGTPVPIDVDENGQITAQTIQRKLTKRTKVIVVVHLYGHVGNIEEIIVLAKSLNITVIEDCAQAFGSTFRGKPVGLFGDIACLSFYPTKNLYTLGDGGAIIAKSKKFDVYFKMARTYGESVRYHSQFICGHSRLPELQACFINCIVQNARNMIHMRKQKMHRYVRTLKEHKIDQIEIIKSSEAADPAPHLFVIKTKKRKQLQAYLTSKGIPTAIHYPTPIHLVSAFSFLGKRKGDFPMAEKLSESVLSLPFYDRIPNTHISYIARAISDFFEHSGDG